MLREVVAFKDRFYHSAWAGYAEAKPKTFHILPNKINAEVLSKDYKNMTGMIFGIQPTWDEILTSLANLETQINNL